MENADTEPEVVDGLPVLAHSQEVVVADAAPLAVRQAAAVAVGSFAAGAATLALAHRRKARAFTRRGRRRRKGAIGEVIATNSFLVDVHLLRRP